MSTMSGSERQTPQRSGDDPVRALEASLEGLIETHERLVELARQQRDAIARADPQALAESIRISSSVLEQIARLEAGRVSAVNRILRSGQNGHPTIRPAATGAEDDVQDQRIHDVAARLPEPAQRRTVRLADRLREVLLTLRSEQRVVCAAAETVAAHVRGLFEQVGRSLNESGTYTAMGSGSSVQGSAALDMTT